VSFSYLHVLSRQDALAALAEPGTIPVAGGTDLVPLHDEGILSPARVVDVRALPGAREITRHADGAFTLGAAVTIAELATHEDVRTHLPVLAAACESVGTPALRNAGTLGGNLAQRHHCWYFRRGVGCFKRGGSQCAAVDGEHRYHGIIASGTCRAAHPSDPAVALMALDAEVQVAKAESAERQLSIAALYAGAADDPHKEAQLADGELIVAVRIPAAAAGGAQHWEKVMQRGAWDFALVSCAGARRPDGAVRLVLGGVGIAPWRINLSVEEDVAVGGLDEDSIDALVERALYDAQPLAHNGYKVQLAQAALKRTIQGL
jgi:xanthine dehydrogenase YagS FAD-binding subunit